MMVIPIQVCRNPLGSGGRGKGLLRQSQSNWLLKYNYLLKVMVISWHVAKIMLFGWGGGGKGGGREKASLFCPSSAILQCSFIVTRTSLYCHSFSGEVSSSPTSSTKCQVRLWSWFHA